MRWWWGGLLLCLVVLGIWAWWRASQPVISLTSHESGVLLKNRPGQFCPTEADVVVTVGDSDMTLFEGQTSVHDCQRINISSEKLAQAVTYHFFVRVTGARAFQVTATGPIKQLIEASVQAGDVNNDNTIDSLDRKLVEDSLGQLASGTLAADVDGDKIVTVLDYALVRFNEGAGVSRPDKAPWSQL